MQLRVNARELTTALTLLKPIIRSPRLVDTTILHCVRLDDHATTGSLWLTAANLTTQMTVVLARRDGTDEGGCVDFASLLRFARASGDQDMTMVATAPDTVLLSCRGSGEVFGGFRDFLPLHPVSEFPRSREILTEIFARGVLVGDLAAALERVSLGGQRTHPSALNEITLWGSWVGPLLALAYGDCGRLTRDVVGNDGVYSGVKVLLDGCSVQPLLGFLKSAPAMTCDLFLGERALSIHIPEYGSIRCQTRRSLESWPSYPPLPVVLPIMVTMEPEDLTRMVRMLAAENPATMIRFRGECAGSLRLGVEGEPRQAVIEAPIQRPFAVSVPAYTLLDLAKLAHESALVMRGDWHGPLVFGLADDEAFAYTILQTEWGNRE